MSDQIRIALIDDDPAVLDALRLYLQQQDVKATAFCNAQEFLSAIDSSPSFDCIVSDVRMPGISGLDLIRHLDTRRLDWPIILITGHGDIDMAVSAMKIGAFDFLEKPFDEGRLLVSIKDAVEQNRRHLSATTEREELQKRMNSLSPRQRQVMELVVAGLSSKEIAIKLNLSEKTVANHRAWIMERAGARNVAELVRLSHKAAQPVRRTTLFGL